LLVLAPSLPIAELENIDWIETNETTAIPESVRETVRELERRQLLVSREEGI
jgi:hypothetical protein